MDNSFKISVSNINNSDYIELHSNIDASAEKQLQKIPSMVNNKVVRFDFSKAGRINSMGIALLLRCFRQIREERDAEIFLKDLSTTNAMLFKMTGVFLLANHEK
jgi:anti-anti-sigma regulatory factor